ncbi:MAG: hypothetical protein LBE12_19045 [Planctomycetaceae bacterium]|nr:hypothetical protein [Planctomycetaceae bacterium]
MMIGSGRRFRSVEHEGCRAFPVILIPPQPSCPTLPNYSAITAAINTTTSLRIHDLLSSVDAAFTEKCCLLLITYGNVSKMSPIPKHRVNFLLLINIGTVSK